MNGTTDRSFVDFYEALQISVKGGVNLDHFGGAKVDQLVKG